MADKNALGNDIKCNTEEDSDQEIAHDEFNSHNDECVLQNNVSILRNEDAAKKNTNTQDNNDKQDGRGYDDKTSRLRLLPTVVENECSNHIPSDICEKGAVGVVNSSNNHNRAALNNNIEQGASGMEHDRNTDNITPGYDTLEQIAMGTEHVFNNGNITPRGDRRENRVAEMVHDYNTNTTPENAEDQPGGITHDKRTVDHYCNPHTEPAVTAAPMIQDSTNDVTLHGRNTCGEVNPVNSADTIFANKWPKNNIPKQLRVIRNYFGRQCDSNSHDGSIDHHTDQHGDLITDNRNLQKRSNMQTENKSPGKKYFTSSSIRKKSHNGDAKKVISKYSVNSDTNKNKSNTNVSTCQSTTLTEGNVTPPGVITRSDGVESSTISANIAEGEEATINRTEGSSNETGAGAENFCQTPRQNISCSSNANTRDDDRVGPDNAQSADNNYHHTDEMVVSLNNPGTVDLNPYSQPIGVYYEIDMHFANRLFPCDNEATEPRPHLDMSRADGSLPNNDAQEADGSLLNNDDEEPDGSLPNNDDEDNTYYDNQDNEDF